MNSQAEYRTTLRTLDRSAWAAFLQRRSGLPGPRANLELAQAVADEGDATTFDTLLATDDEFLVLCGTIGLGRLLAERPNAELEHRLRRLAADPPAGLPRFRALQSSDDADVAWVVRQNLTKSRLKRVWR